jgi:hypothetical protein
MKVCEKIRKTNLVNLKFFIFAAFASGVLQGCNVNTEGTLNIKGKVLDEITKTGIPGKDIILQGLVDIDNKSKPVEAGQFSTDSSGSFSFSFGKIKGARSYRFCFVGDSENLYTTNDISLYNLEKNAEFLYFTLKKLVDLTIRLNRISKTPVWDTLRLSWESNEVYFWFLYPYKTENYAGNSLKPATGTGLIWMGGDVNSTVSTKVFADRMTKISWELYRNGKRSTFIDTITCKRDFANTVYFTY